MHAGGASDPQIEPSSARFAPQDCITSGLPRLMVLCKDLNSAVVQYRVTQMTGIFEFGGVTVALQY